MSHQKNQPYPNFNEKEIFDVLYISIYIIFFGIHHCMFVFFLDWVELELVGKSGSESEPSDNVMSMSMSWSSEVKSLFLTKNHSFTKATRNLLHDHWCLQLFFFFRFGGVLKLQDVGQQYCCNHCWGESKSSKAKGKHTGSFKEEVSMGSSKIWQHFCRKPGNPLPAKSASWDSLNLFSTVSLYCKPWICSISRPDVWNNYDNDEKKQI